MNEYDNNNGYSTAGDGGQSYGYGTGGGATPPQTPRKKPKKGVGTGAVVAICLICALLAAALGVGGTWFYLHGGFTKGTDALVEATPVPTEVPPNDGPAPTEAPAAEPTPAPTPETDAVTAQAAVGEKIYDLAKKQAVGITTEITYTNYFGQISSASVSGTGFIISDDGYIMTNNHVIEEARQGGYEVSVLMYDGTEYTADIVGYDAANDIAVLKVDAEGLTPVEMGSADDIVVGREIYPVGNPLGELNFTMTTGIISATDRTITTDTDSAPINMFQIDAAVNSGNSGGPVYDGDGEVIGVVTAKSSATGVEGLGFAIPIEDAAHIAEQLIQYGYVTDRATLGITGITITDSMAERYGLTVGAYVRTVTPDGPAAQAGLQERDIITALNGEPVAGFTELTTMVRTYDVGDTAELTVWRGGETVTMEVTFGESQPPVETTPVPQQEQGQQYQYGFGNMDDFFRQFFGGFAW